MRWSHQNHGAGGGGGFCTSIFLGDTTVCIFFFSFCSIGQKLVLIVCKFYLRFCGLHIKLLFHFGVGKEIVNDAQNKTLSPIKVLVNK